MMPPSLDRFERLELDPEEPSRFLRCRESCVENLELASSMAPRTPFKVGFQTPSSRAKSSAECKFIWVSNSCGSIDSPQFPGHITYSDAVEEAASICDGNPREVKEGEEEEEEEEEDEMSDMADDGRCDGTVNA